MTRCQYGSNFAGCVSIGESDIYKLVCPWHNIISDDLCYSYSSDLVYRLKRTGPRTDPCGTQNGIYLGHEREPDMLIPWYWFDKYELNPRRAVSVIPKCLCTQKNVMINCIKHS